MTVCLWRGGICELCIHCFMAPGDRHFTVLLCSNYCGGLCCPSVKQSLHRFPIKSITCVYSVIFSPKAVYGVSCCFFRPKMFSPGDHVWYLSRTLRANVLRSLHQMGRSFATFSTYALVGFATPWETITW